MGNFSYITSTRNNSYWNITETTYAYSGSDALTSYTASATVTYDGGDATSLSDQKVEVSSDGTKMIYRNFQIGSDVIGDLTVTGVTATTSDGTTTYELTGGSATLSNYDYNLASTYNISEGATIPLAITGTYDATNGFKAKFTTTVNSKEAVVLYNGYSEFTPTEPVEYSTDYAQLQTKSSYDNGSTYMYAVFSKTGQKVTITQTATDRYTFVYTDYYYDGNNELGDVTVAGVAGSTDSDGYVNYEFNGNGTLFNTTGTLSTLGITDNATVPVVITGRSKDGTLEVKISVLSANTENTKVYNIMRFNYIETVTLDEDADNSEVIKEYNGLWVNINTKRTLQKDKWNTFCVPFNIPSTLSLFNSQYFTVKEYDKVDGNKMYLKTATEIKAGQPYLIKPKVIAWSGPYTFDRTKSLEYTIKALDTNNPGKTTSVGDGDFTFVGTYSPKTFTEDEAKKALILISDGTLVNPTATTMGGMRAYFTYSGESGESVAPRVVIDGVETALTEVVGSEEVSDGRIYNLRGMYVGHDASKLAKGVYIMNGKKIVLK